MNASILSEPTLVLDRNWLPVRVCSVRRALTMVFRGLATCIGDDYSSHDFSSWVALGVKGEERVIRTVTWTFRVPEVVVLARATRHARPRVAFSRRNLFRRDHHTCQYCGRRLAHEELSIDHVVPRSHGGRSEWKNCVAACTKCNAKKANRSPAEAGMKTLRPPREPPAAVALAYQIGSIRHASWEQFVGRLSLDEA